jgi:site-specific DNA recombinase
MARVLGALRLSHDTEASTSIERQHDAVTGWAQSKAHKVVHISEDTDVSGATAPHDRAELGPWLRGPNLAKWDVLAVAKLDRISRSLIDFVNLLEWLEARGKTLVSVGDGLDFSEPKGAFVGKILVLFAEFERETMRDRRASAAAKLYSRGGYNGGGSLPWGYRAVERNGQIILEPDPDLVAKISGIAGAVIGGQSVQSVAQRLGFDHARLLRRLKSPSLKGVVTFKGQIVRGDDGTPLLREPVLPAAAWSRLQVRLDANSVGAGVRRDAYPWLGVMVCRECGEGLYFQRWSRRPEYSYLNHKPSLRKYTGEDARERCRCSFREPEVVAQIEPMLLGALGDTYVPEVVEIPGDDNAAELEEVEESIRELETDRYERKLFKGAAGAARYAALMTKLESRAEVLRARESVPARRELVYPSQTFGEMWSALETDRERGALLRRMGFRVLVFKDAAGRTRVQLRQRRPQRLES